MMKATPNSGHQSITMLQQELLDLTINVVTQNVDLLHEKAGTKNIYHIHGRIDECICMNCGHVQTSLGDVESDETCPECHVQGMLKPNIVFFGEMPKYMDEVDKMLAECGMFIAIGTSGIVYPRRALCDRQSSMAQRPIYSIWILAITALNSTKKFSVKPHKLSRASPKI